MKRKVFFAVAMFAMATMLTACGGTDPDELAGKITPGVTNEKEDDATPTKAAEDKDVTGDRDVAEDKETTGEKDDTEDKDAAGDKETTEDKEIVEDKETAGDKETTGEPETAGDEDEEGDKATSLGRVQGGVYINEYMGISCTLDENWEFYTAEELQELPKNVEELFEGTDAEEVMDSLQVIADMSAENVSELTTMNIQYQKISAQERQAFAAMDNSTLLDALLVVQKSFMIDTYAQVGIDVKDMYKKSVMFCGEQRDVLYTESEMEGVPYYIAQIIDYSLGDYSVTMTVSSFLEDKTDDLLQLFSKYE